MPGELRAPLIQVDPLAEGSSDIRAPLISVDPLAEGYCNLRSPLVTLDPLSEGNRNLRASLLMLDPLAEGYRNLRIALLCIEALCPVEPEGHVSTELFPGSPGSPIALPGLAYSVHKIPSFATNKKRAASGVRTATALRQYPIWEFEFTYEFLEDSSGADSSLKSLMGFFLSRQGDFDTFLFKDPDDYSVSNGPLGTADGATTQFSFKRTLGGFAEKIGQIDSGQPIILYGTIDEAGSIPASPGPYSITVAHSAAFIEDLGVSKGGVAMVKVASGPAAGQYSESGGVYSFAAADQGQAISIRYRYELDAGLYTITLPNLVVFASAPASGMLISADFEFFFNCAFQESSADFEKFADKLWQLQQINFETVPQ